MSHVKSRSPLGLSNLSIAGFSAAIIASSAFACSGIDESTLFSGGDGGSESTTDGGSGDSGTKKDGGTSVDSGGPITPTGGVVQCASGDCNIDSNQVCCYATDTQTGTCELGANCNGDDVFPIPCDSTSDCAEIGKPDTVCCAQADSNGNVNNVECKSAADCRFADGQTNLCDPSVANPCPNGGTCMPSTVSLPGYDICVE